MRNRFKVLSVVSMLIVLVTACANFSAPSDAQIEKAIKETGLFSGEPGKFLLQSPIVVLEKSKTARDGVWLVKTKMTFSQVTADGKESQPLERSPDFRFFKVKDSSGKMVWKAELGA